MNIPKELKYTKTHEWVQKMDNGNLRVGLSDFAQSELGDLVFINLPQVGDKLELGAIFADVESVKAVSDIYCPASGAVAAVNSALEEDPAAVNTDCYAAWLIELSEVGESEELLDADAYQALIAGEG